MISPDEPLVIDVEGRRFRCWTDPCFESADNWWIFVVDGEEHELAPVGSGDDEATVREQLRCWVGQLHA